jgi:hypothetical protein
MSAHIGLYFPYFHFPSDNWVKVSALYWDKMYRIVPSYYQTRRDTDLVKVLCGQNKEKTGFIANIDPDAFYVDLHDISIQFIRLIENHTQELVKYYGIENRDKWEVNEYTSKISPESDTRLAYIYNEKIDYELGQILDSRGLGTRRGSNEQGREWIGMHPRLANVYMSALAERLSLRAGAHPVASDSINYFAITGFTFERLAQVLLDRSRVIAPNPTEDELEAGLATFALKSVMPKDFDKISIDQILEIREKYSGQFGGFQDFIHHIIDQLPSLQDISGNEFVNDHLRAEYNKSIKPKIEELDDALNNLDIETIPAVINMETVVPKFFAVGGLLAGAALINPALGVTSAVAMGLWKIISDKRKAVKKALDASDVSFLMHVRDDLTPAGSLDWLAIQASKLIDGT